MIDATMIETIDATMIEEIVAGRLLAAMTGSCPPPWLPAFPAQFGSCL